MTIYVTSISYTMKTYNKNNRGESQAGLGILLVIVGSVLLALNFHWIPIGIKSWLISWQMLLIVLGLIIVVTKSDKTGGLILLFIGGFFLAREHFFMFYDMRRWFLPSLIIFIGIIFLFKDHKNGSLRSGNRLNNNNYKNQ